MPEIRFLDKEVSLVVSLGSSSRTDDGLAGEASSVSLVGVIAPLVGSRPVPAHQEVSMPAIGSNSVSMDPELKG